MSHETSARNGRALGVILATVALAGCAETHPMTDAATPSDAAPANDAAVLVDAAPPPDAGMPDDAAVALVDAATVADAATVDAWADVPDAYYPDGIRG